MNNTSENIEAVITEYERLFGSGMYRTLFGDSGFCNLGFWETDTLDPVQASRNLVDQLLTGIRNERGAILEVGCGRGGTTQRICEIWGGDSVTAINISELQLESARKRAPDCEFLLMDAAEMTFPDNTFDCVVCIEAAFHFNSRADFLRHARRVLKPKGCLVLSDELYRWNLGSAISSVPSCNYVGTKEEYEALLRDAGFVNIQMTGALEKTWKPFRKFMLQRVTEAIGEAYVGAAAAWKLQALVEGENTLKGSGQNIPPSVVMEAFGSLLKVQQACEAIGGFWFEKYVLWDLLFSDYLLISAYKSE